MQFFHLPASCSSAVKAALVLTGEPFTTEVVDLSNQSDAFRRANPLAKVPALLDADGAMFEGGAINLWLSQKHPDSGLMPDLGTLTGRDALMWLFFCYGTVHPAWARLFYPGRVAGAGDHDQAFALARADLVESHAMLAGALASRDFLAGAHMSLADLYLAATLHWEGKIEGELTQTFPALAAHRARVLAEPGVAQAIGD